MGALIYTIWVLYRLLARNVYVLIKHDFISSFTVAIYC